MNVARPTNMMIPHGTCIPSGSLHWVARSKDGSVKGDIEHLTDYLLPYGANPHAKPTQLESMVPKLILGSREAHVSSCLKRPISHVQHTRSQRYLQSILDDAEPRFPRDKWALC